jgi:hypothetical protein
VNNFVMPWYGIICPPDAKGPSTVFFSTPVDDTTHRAWFVHFNPHRPLGMTVMSASPGCLELSAAAAGDAAHNWGQNRDLMKRGHATGFRSTWAPKDFAMFISQGAIHDRTQETLCSADGAVLRVRSLLLKAAASSRPARRRRWRPTPSSTTRRRVGRRRAAGRQRLARARRAA